jgi:hypothetical protein
MYLFQVTSDFKIGWTGRDVFNRERRPKDTTKDIYSILVYIALFRHSDTNYPKSKLECVGKNM